jgi:hypothetical protein
MAYQFPNVEKLDEISELLKILKQDISVSLRINLNERIAATFGISYAAFLSNCDAAFNFVELVMPFGDDIAYRNVDIREYHNEGDSYFLCKIEPFFKSAEGHLYSSGEHNGRGKNRAESIITACLSYVQYELVNLDEEEL